MAKFLISAMAGGIAMSALYAAPAYAISNSSECESEGGSMVTVKSSDYCLVPMRDEAYADPVYDGNKLGVIECPGSKLNDGDYCLYPVTIRPEPTVDSEASSLVDQVTDTATDMAKDTATDMAKDTATEAVKDEAKKGFRKLF